MSTVGSNFWPRYVEYWKVLQKLKNPQWLWKIFSWSKHNLSASGYCRPMYSPFLYGPVSSNLLLWITRTQGQQPFVTLSSNLLWKRFYILTHIIPEDFAWCYKSYSPIIKSRTKLSFRNKTRMRGYCKTSALWKEDTDCTSFSEYPLK